MKTTGAPPRQNNGRRDAIATDRRKCVQFAGTVAAAVIWPLGGEVRAATSEAESDKKSEGPPATFTAGGHAVEARKIQAGPQFRAARGGGPPFLSLALCDSHVTGQVIDTDGHTVPLTETMLVGLTPPRP